MTSALASLIRTAVSRVALFWAQVKTLALSALVIALAFGALAALAIFARDIGRNRTIAALADNHDVPVAQSAAPRLLFARAFFLITDRQLDEAQGLVSLFDLRGDDEARADLHYDLGNGRLLEAFDKIESDDFDAAGPLVGLAQENYIEAMRLNPDDWNARYNFDVATRLVRQYPSFANTPDPRRQGPRPIWTELPNVPRGEP
jgi:mxaK protein